MRLSHLPKDEAVLQRQTPPWPPGKTTQLRTWSTMGATWYLGAPTRRKCSHARAACGITSSVLAMAAASLRLVDAVESQRSAESTRRSEEKYKWCSGPSGPVALIRRAVLSMPFLPVDFDVHRLYLQFDRGPAEYGGGRDDALPRHDMHACHQIHRS